MEFVHITGEGDDSGIRAACHPLFVDALCPVQIVAEMSAA